jgi:hypothetical protein
MFLLSNEKRGLFQFKNMFLNPKTGNKKMFLKVRVYGVSVNKQNYSPNGNVKFLPNQSLTLSNNGFP